MNEYTYLIGLLVFGLLVDGVLVVRYLRRRGERKATFAQPRTQQRANDSYRTAAL